MAKGLVMGETDAGKTWCIKALHPSDPLVEVRGIPDKSAVPSVFLNYQSTFTLAPPGTAEATWKFDMAMTPHPVNFLSGYKAYSSNAGPGSFSFLNQQLTGDYHYAKYRVFRGMCERWRLAYMAVTVYQDAPALADQGTIVVSQLPVKPQCCNLGSSILPIGAPQSPMYMSSLPGVEMYHPGDRPEYERSQAMPNAYFSKSREGAYVPLKLTKTCQKWHSAADSVFNVDYVPNQVALGVAGQESWEYFDDAMSTALTVVGDKAAYDAVAGGSYPFFGLHDVMRVASWSTGTLTPQTVWMGEATSPMCNDTWAHISARNLSTSTSYSFFVRCGFEVQVQPGSVLSPELKLSPTFDEVALSTYFKIAREMKDAYPADYNDLGKIWNVIKGVASTVAPVLKVIPGIGPIVSTAEQAVRGVKQLNAIYNPKKGSRDKLAAGDLERMQNFAAKAASVMPPGVPFRVDPDAKPKKKTRRGANGGARARKK